MHKKPKHKNQYLKKDQASKLNLREHALKPSFSKPEGHSQTTQPKAARSKKPRGKFSYAVRYILTSALIFMLSTLAMNFTAYSAIIQQYYYDITGTTKNVSLLEYSQIPEAKASLSLKNLKDTASIANTQNQLGFFNTEVVPPGTRVIIPRLGTNVPVLSVPDTNLFQQNWDALERDIQSTLLDGVIHYPGTPLPNKSGNVVITGHSSYYPWNKGRYKDVFAVLHNINMGDELIMFHKQKKYVYAVTQIEKIYPEDVEVLGDAGDDRLTLITCTPIGTNIKRLVVTAKPIASLLTAENLDAN